MHVDMKSTYDKIFWLAVFTIGYNFVEGLISVWFGIGDETLALFGFGADSFVEVISGVGILQMVIRISKKPGSDVGPFEKKSLRITGFAFLILAVSLVAGAGINIFKGHKPETTFPGIIISFVSILIMYWLYSSKMSCGRKLNAEPVFADAKCTLVCIYMSVILLASSLIYEFTGFGWVDTIGALGLAWFSFSEGREALEKAAS
jgi:divalent metal cation (Fe/Co/Zn/Cd) transporter